MHIRVLRVELFSPRNMLIFHHSLLFSDPACIVFYAALEIQKQKLLKAEKEEGYSFASA
jgi:hypothetical protein